MAKKGVHKYVPAFVLDELEQIKKENDIKKDSIAFHEMAKNARIGRELDKITKIDMGEAIKLPSLIKVEKLKRRSLF